MTMRHTFTVSFQVEVEVPADLVQDAQETLEDSDLMDGITDTVRGHLDLAPIQASLVDTYGLTCTKGVRG